MNKYEIVYILDAHAPQGTKDDLIKQVADAIVKFGGVVVNSTVWFERHKMSFPMKKRWEGTYYLVNFEMPAEGLAKLRQLLRINEQLLRVLILRVDSHKEPVKAAPVEV